MVPVMDSNRITAIGDGLRHSSVNKQAYFRVNTAAAGAADLAVKVTSELTKNVLSVAMTVDKCYLNIL